MLYLRMYRADLGTDSAERLTELKAEISKLLRPIVQPTIETPAAILGVGSDVFARSTRIAESAYEPSKVVTDGEVFTDGEALFVIVLRAQQPRRILPSRQGSIVSESQAQVRRQLDISAIGPCWDSPSLAAVLSGVERVLGVVPSASFFPSQRFETLKSEGRESPAATSPEELKASELLCDKSIRTLAIAIKASGGLLVRDVPKQLQPEFRDKHEVLIASLKSAQLEAIS